MTKDKVEAEPKKKGKFKKLLLIGVAAIALIGAGAGAGIYFGALSAHEAKPEDNYPKLVERSTKDEAPAAEGADAEGPRRRGLRGPARALAALAVATAACLAGRVGARQRRTPRSRHGAGPGDGACQPSRPLPCEPPAFAPESLPGCRR